MRKISTFLTALLIAISIRQADSAILPPDKLLPDNTLVIATIPDFNDFQKVMKDSAQGQLWNDPSMSEFKAKFWNKFKQQYVSSLERSLSIHLDDYTNLLHGQITLAITDDGMDKSVPIPGVLILVDVREGSAQLKTNLTALKQKWIDMGKNVKTEKIRDVDFSMITLSPGDFGKTSKSTDSGDASTPSAKNSVYVGQMDSLLIIGNSTAAIEKVLSRQAGGSVKSVSELGNFAANAPLFHDSPLYMWINSKALVDRLNQQFSQSDADATHAPLGLRPEKVLSALGLSGLNSIALSYRYNAEGAAFSLTLAAPESTRTGLLKLFVGEPKDSTPPAFVPADIIKFQRVRLDGQKTYKNLRKILSDASPAAVGALDYALSAGEAVATEKDPDFTFNKDLFGQLGDDIIVYQKSAHSDSLADINGGPSLFLIGSPNPEKLASALKNTLVIFNLPATSVTDKDFLGHKVYSLSLPGAAGTGRKKAPAKSFSYAASAGYLAVTTDSGLLEEFLRSSEKTGKGLRDISGFNDAVQKVSAPGTYMLGYGNDTEVSRFTFDALKKEANSPDPLASLAPLTSAMGMNDIKVSDWIDLSLLPPFSKVAKYFYFSVYSGSANSDGITFKFYAPMPPQLRK